MGLKIFLSVIFLQFSGPNWKGFRVVTREEVLVNDIFYFHTSLWVRDIEFIRFNFNMFYNKMSLHNMWKTCFFSWDSKHKSMNVFEPFNLPSRIETHTLSWLVIAITLCFFHQYVSDINYYDVCKSNALPSI